MNSLIKFSMAFLLLTLSSLSLEAKTKPAKRDTVYFSCYMDCHGCVTDIEKQLTFTRGVRKLKVDLPSNTVMVVYSPRKTTKEKVKASFKEIEKEPAFITKQAYLKKVSKEE